MSYGEDVLTEIRIDNALYYAEVERQAKNGVWETKDGKKIRVEDMSTDHINNTVKLLERKNVCDLWLPWIERFKKELERRKIVKRSVKYKKI